MPYRLAIDRTNDLTWFLVARTPNWYERNIKKVKWEWTVVLNTCDVHRIRPYNFESVVIDEQDV